MAIPAIVLALAVITMLEPGLFNIISSSQPLYVLAMNPYKNALVVGSRDQLGRDRLLAEHVNWVSGAPPALNFRAQVQIRYRAKAQPAAIEVGDGQTFRVVFDEPQRDITPGQAAVIYQGDRLPRRRPYR